jgi:hypothetical protein
MCAVSSYHKPSSFLIEAHCQKLVVPRAQPSLGCPEVRTLKKRKKRQNGAKNAGRGLVYAAATPFDVEDEEGLHNESAVPAAEEDEDEGEWRKARQEN